MAAFQAYRESKDSKIEWVGEIPKHWGVKPLFGVASTESVKNEDGKESNVLSLSYGNIIRRDVEKNFGLLPESFNTYQLVNSGELILRLTDLQNDKRSLRVGHAKERGIITSAYLKLTAKESELNDRYLYRLLHSYDTTKVFYGMGGGLRQSMKFEEMRRLPVLVPSLEEQQKIANFLDYETAKIDILIEKQQQLIKLLKEKRQAVISHAVTKGLNPNAPMRNSGVEWLGEVPEHWLVTRAKYVSDIFIPQRNKPELNDSDGISWATMEDMKSPYIESTKQFVSEIASKDAGSKTLKAGSIIASCVGNFGIASINKVDVVINQQLQAFIPRGIKAEYLREIITTSTVYFNLIGTAATLVYVNQQGFENLPALVPPESEQNEICAYVGKAFAKFDKLMKKSESMVSLLQERRTALISAAVTGKIDVRNWVAPSDPCDHDISASDRQGR